MKGILAIFKLILKNRNDWRVWVLGLVIMAFAVFIILKSFGINFTIKSQSVNLSSGAINNGAIANGDNARATVNRYPPPEIDYRIESPSKIRNNGSYYTTFQISISYAGGTIVSLQKVRWISPITECREISKDDSIAIDALRGNRSTDLYSISCFSSEPVKAIKDFFYYAND